MSKLEDSLATTKEQVELVANRSELDEAMANESKEVTLEKLADQAEGHVNPARTNDDGIFSMLYSAAKKVATVGIIYLVGYMGWSVAWLITPVILSVTRDQWKKVSEAKRNVAKASAMASERDVILARIDELPAWVYFPDVERCEWLNRIIKQVWPNANHFARTLLKDTIEPNINKALEGYKLRGFKFDRMILGQIPPRIGGVKVYDKNVARNEIILDIDLFYASDCDINFTLAGVRGGIKDFQIHGMLRVIMKPLIKSAPFIGGLQIFFLNNPNIDFNLVGVIDLLDMPGLSDMLRRVIVEQVAALMVLPNKLPIQLSDEIPALALKMPEPEGVLRIHVVEAKDLMKKDIGVLTKGKSDPYAIITVGAQQFRTQTIDSNVNPKWDYWCEGIVHAEMGQFLHIELKDEDKSSDDELLGRATVEISSIVKKGEIDTWLTLEEAKHGLLHLRLSWLRLSNDRNDLKYALEETQMLRVTSMSTALVTIFIDSAKNLPHARVQSSPDPYLVISVGKKTEQTTTQMRTDSPIWEQGFTFLVSNPDNDTVQMKIIDQKTEKELGRLTYVLSNLLNKKNLEIVSQPFQLQKSGPESKLNMSLQLRIFKKTDPIEDDVLSISSSEKMVDIGGTSIKSGTTESSVSRSSSFKQPAPFQPLPDTASQLSKQDSKMSSSSGIGEDIHPEDIIFATTTTIQLASTPPRSPDLSDGSEIYHRTTKYTATLENPSVTPDSACKIQVTLRYSVQRQRLMVIIHKIVNIPMKDPSNIPDPYVKLYLLPGRSKESKQKTGVCKDNCNPVFDQQFEYIISSAELKTSELEVTAATQKGFLSSGTPVIGVVRIPLSDPEISQQGITEWHELLRDSKDD